MRIQTQNYNDVTVVELQGDFDSDYTEMFGNTVQRVLGEKKSGIVLDMTCVGFIDSEGLEKLIWARDYCRDNKSQMRLAGLSENCSQIFKVTRLDKDFDSYKELSEAVKSFA